MLFYCTKAGTVVHVTALQDFRWQRSGCAKSVQSKSGNDVASPSQMRSRSADGGQGLEKIEETFRSNRI